MRLTINHPEIVKLAQSLAQETGESLTRAIEIVLQERLARIRRSRMAALLRIGRRCTSHLKQKPTHHSTMLYDETGR